jgi:hypothetical protein
MPSEKQIATLLLDLGVQPHFDGYRYSIEAIKMLLDGRPVWGGLISVIYPKVAEKFNKDYKQVERSIRYAKGIAQSTQTPTWERVIGRCLGMNESLGNAQFLTLVAEYLRLGLDEGVAI